DINAVDEMWAKFNEGFDVVYGVRSKRTTDTFFKRFSAEGFYKIMGAMGVDIVFNHADYRLMSQRALQTLSEFNEVNLFLRGVVPMIGYPSTTVMYERAERFAGETKYPLSKMLMLAIEGITSLSIRPIRLITVIGFLSFLISLIILVYSIVDRLTGGTVEGWASIIVSIWAIGGLQLLAIGIIGEYIGKVYLEVKARPKYVIQDIVARDIAKINIDISDNVSEEK
ncbi:MAG: glycosyltransferase, partial [Firmicutes bacterium]|nr:glycosyltransferase [Bacillota bacterium]